MSYIHGVSTSEQSTGVFSPVRTESLVPFVVGTAPVHMIKEGETGSVNKAELCYSLKEAVALFGESSDWDNYTLCEAIDSEFRLFGVAPIVLVNVFDPSVHKEIAVESVTLSADDSVSVANVGLLSAVVKNEAGDTTYTDGIDYDIDMLTGVISRISTGAIAEGSIISVDYTYGDPSKVTAADIIGGIDSATGTKSGMELVNTVFPKFGIVPGTMIAPGWSHDSTVAAVLKAKSTNINNHFKAIGIVDVDDTVCRKYSDVSEYKNLNNLVDPNLVVCWLKLGLGDAVYHQSTQLASLMQKRAAESRGVPYESPSNKNYQMDRALANGSEVILGNEEASYLNSQGVVTAINFIGGWVSWGNRTSDYPSNTDVKDSFIASRQMYNWFQTELVLTYWKKIDKPMNRRLIEQILDSLNYRLNSLASGGYILGGRVEFDFEENSVTDLLDGIANFHVYLSTVVPMVEAHFTVEYDVNYFSTLFN